MDAAEGAKRDIGRAIMDAQPIGGKSDAVDVGGETAGGDDARMLQARLDILVARLWAAVWINPSLTFLWMLPFLGFYPIFGTVSWVQFAFIMLMQFSISVAAVHLRFAFFLVQLGISMCWVYQLLLKYAA